MNIGKKEASEIASALEKAGLENNIKFIDERIDGFIAALEALIDLFKTEDGRDSDVDIIEDSACLVKQLRIIIAACEDYDDDAVYKTLDSLSEKPWKNKTSNALGDIRHLLAIGSDFDEAAQKATQLLSRIGENQE